MRRASASETLARVLGIGAVITLLISVIVVLGPAAANRYRPARLSPIRPAAPGPAIGREANVFRLRPGDQAVEPAAESRSGARPRTLDMHRLLRAFAGAPPRIPHGLTDDEYRRTLCASCHERGGYVARFGAYAPVTPHPESAECLQCHLPDAAKIGIGFPNRVNPVMCGQCHPVPGARMPIYSPLDWPPPRWPVLNQHAMKGSPTLIPHDTEFRNNCLACHGGPGAIAEIRTTHPERSNCRQCHVQAATGVEDFVRPPSGSGRPGGEPR